MNFSEFSSTIRSVFEVYLGIALMHCTLDFWNYVTFLVLLKSCYLDESLSSLSMCKNSDYKTKRCQASLGFPDGEKVIPCLSVVLSGGSCSILIGLCMVFGQHWSRAVA